MRRCAEVSELLTVSTGPASLANNRRNFAFNTEMVSNGIRMISLFDTSNVSDDYLDFIIGAVGMPYYHAFGPIPIKIFDRKAVMLEGPVRAKARCVMVVSRPDFVRAALLYVTAVQRYAVPASEFRQRVLDLSHRQHAVARLLGNNHNDETIADLLGLSVRTVRQDVAGLLSTLDASTRFAAGARYVRILDSDAGSK